ncbi:MAG: gamma-glutamyl-gamma-aminobutyrate hydrolase family protein [Clostridia bacterium]
MHRYPMIGISGSIDKEDTKHFLLRDYMLSIIAAGGIPLMLSPDMDEQMLGDCLTRMDGLLLAGGNDVNPVLYGHLPVEALGEVNPLRDAFELRLLRQAALFKLPTLGICRGIQMMNVALGGTLYQDLPSQFLWETNRPPMKHQQSCAGQYASHQVHIKTDTLLHQIEGRDDIAVNSFHHEAIWDIAPNLRVCATAQDGVIEGIEHVSLPFFLAVQWHPERMHATDEQAAALFEALVREASQYERERERE